MTDRDADMQPHVGIAQKRHEPYGDIPRSRYQIWRRGHRYEAPGRKSADRCEMCDQASPRTQSRFTPGGEGLRSGHR